MKEQLINKIYNNLKSVDYNRIDKKNIEDFLLDLFHFMFNYTELNCNQKDSIAFKLNCFKTRFSEILFHFLNDKNKAEEETNTFFNQLDEVYSLCIKDSEFILKSDPAAQNLREVQLAYPGFFAIFTYRLAHALWKQKRNYYFVIPLLFNQRGTIRQVLPLTNSLIEHLSSLCVEDEVRPI